MAAKSWPDFAGPMLVRRTGPQPFEIPDDVAPATVWHPTAVPGAGGVNNDLAVAGQVHVEGGVTGLDQPGSGGGPAVADDPVPGGERDVGCRRGSEEGCVPGFWGAAAHPRSAGPKGPRGRDIRP